ncbi:Double-stranded DNA-binding domain containing protein [Entamoeba marina]
MSNQQAQQQYKQQQMREQEERRQQLLTSVLEADAKERLASISLVKPEKARQVEDMIMLMCQKGQMTGKINEGGLISLIDQINENKTETKVTIVHKKDDDFDDLDIDDL